MWLTIGMLRELYSEISHEMEGAALVMALFTQRQFVRGLTLGALKG